MGHLLRVFKKKKKKVRGRRVKEDWQMGHQQDLSSPLLLLLSLTLDTLIDLGFNVCILKMTKVT